MKKKKRKPKLWRMLLWRVPLLSVLFVLIAGEFINRDYRRIEQEAWYSHVQFTKDTLEYIRKIKNTEGIKAEDTLINMRLCADAERMTYDGDFSCGYLAIKDRKTEEIIADSKESLYLTIVDDNVNPKQDDRLMKNYCFRCENEELIGWIKSVREDYKQNQERLIIFSANPVILRDGSFLPESLSIYEYLDEESSMKLVEKKEFDIPKNELVQGVDTLEGVTAISMGGVEIGYYLTLYGSDSLIDEESFQKMDWKETEKKGYYMSGGGTSSYEYPKLNEEYELWNRYFWKGDMTFVCRIPYSEKSTEQNGKEIEKQYVLENYFTTNYWKLAGKSLVRYIAVIYVVLVSLLIFITWLQYYKRKTQFEKATYRKTLTDALSHDLRTPLTSLQGYAESLKEQINSDKKEEYVQGILESAAYMDQLIRANSELLKLEDMGTVKEKEMLDLVSITEKLFEKYNPVLDENHIKLIVLGTFKIKTNRELITEALENLVSNAVKYVNSEGTIIVEGNENELCVSNTVSGFPDAKPEELWTPYVKGDAARSQEKGNGLGLAIVSEILKKHHLKAKIEFQNEAEKKWYVRISKR